MPQPKQVRPIMFPYSKPVLMMPAGAEDAPRGGLLDEFAIWASRFGRRLTAGRRTQSEVRHEA